MTTPPALHLPARDIPVPASLSPEAQAVIGMGIVGPPPILLPLDDHAGWKAEVATREQFVKDMTHDPGRRDGIEIDDTVVAGVHVYKIRPHTVSPDDRRVCLEFHGGGWVQDGGDIACDRAIDTAVTLQATVWAVDYRMPPDHPFPAAVDDGVSVYRALLAERAPGEIIFQGPSAGANIAAATIIAARDLGLPLPAAAALHSGAYDLTEASDSWVTNMGLDNVITGTLRQAAMLYAGEAGLRHPLVSPLFADLTKGFPPTWVNTGTRDVLLSDNVRFHRALRAAGVAAELNVWEAASHAMYLGMAPEDAVRAADMRRFCDDHWARA